MVTDTELPTFSGVPGFEVAAPSVFPPHADMATIANAPSPPCTATRNAPNGVRMPETGTGEPLLIILSIEDTKAVLDPALKICKRCREARSAVGWPVYNGATRGNSSGG